MITKKICFFKNNFINLCISLGNRVRKQVNYNKGGKTTDSPTDSTWQQNPLESEYSSDFSDTDEE